jgi:hypothetical protein
MLRRQKAALMALFASGVLCILIATLRAANVTAHAISTGKAMDGTWLAVWSMAETAVGKPLPPQIWGTLLLQTRQH